MSHERDLADQDVEELAEELWTGGEVQPFGRLAPGESARIVRIVSRQPGHLVKLSNLGVVPGARIHLQQTSPAVVLRLGETVLAVEPEVAGGIYVKRAG